MSYNNEVIDSFEIAWKEIKQKDFLNLIPGFIYNYTKMGCSVEQLKTNYNYIYSDLSRYLIELLDK